MIGVNHRDYLIGNLKTPEIGANLFCTFFNLEHAIPDWTAVLRLPFFRHAKLFEPDSKASELVAPFAVETLVSDTAVGGYGCLFARCKQVQGQQRERYGCLARHYLRYSLPVQKPPEVSILAKLYTG
ncbi:MAG: hypothetical protein BRC41_08490 [Cyanobacteria bacterium QH_9_48_43]|nr:MAG: hypothetical protein BRC35_14605 [Cyanobacteria bacterium QH_10_48_56]PSO58085.1 MAG: hypothetical protein BRC39_13725 [Cyanobacteria bacterium QH_7_48_89]PSO60057.1 MAG: hypothetical protein BRC36_14615 [Cyanobacteria bacterium QH_2_48_84]PSO73003.1 MAG: hypothetical protein BRC37_10480 [Cyanobacteria bacterium QH_3_48_40]PSO78751.1 MAG: hypothetical protein BRC45_16760 [Cyanobacteria bacterium QS_5_48_63]PSO84477.1 MAG: hypothetical protein BRC43_16125 [Cyanobacteria bacterium QS_3_4